MRKAKITPQEDGSFHLELEKSYPELEGKKLVVLTKGHVPDKVDKGGTLDYQLEGDEAIILTEGEFEDIKAKIAASGKGTEQQASAG